MMRGCVTTLMLVAMLLTPIAILGTTTVALVICLVLFVALMGFSKGALWLSERIKRKYGEAESIRERYDEAQIED